MTKADKESSLKKHSPTRWEGEREIELINCPDEDLLKTFPGFSLDTLKRQQRRSREKLKFQTKERRMSANEIPLSEKVQKLLSKRKMTLVGLSDHFSVSPSQIRQALDVLKAKRVIFDVLDDTISLAESLRPTEKRLVIDFSKHKEQRFVFGAIADTHLCSKFERLDVLSSLYERFKEAGVTTVFHGGNMIDGEAKFNVHELLVHGVTDQVRYFVRQYPQVPGVKTKFIVGDDHEGWYVQREHLDVGSLIEDEAHRVGRYDLENLGFLERDIEFKQPHGSAVLRVIHGGGGSAYAHSYTSQKYVEMLQGGEKPSMVIMGHFHKFNWDYPREVHVIQPGCVQDQSTFMRKRRIQAMVGGCIIEVKQNDLGIFTSVKVEWMPYYDKKFYRVNW